mmetsp:Transcript_25613/g.58445  ORF Transcript_25613/g.58445 Transcript_25613/m.58445 type:complete len:624 (+) Transcript_25613:421-2292(+)
MAPVDRLFAVTLVAVIIAGSLIHFAPIRHDVGVDEGGGGNVRRRLMTVSKRVFQGDSIQFVNSPDPKTVESRDKVLYGILADQDSSGKDLLLGHTMGGTGSGKEIEENETKQGQLLQVQQTRAELVEKNQLRQAELRLQRMKEAEGAQQIVQPMVSSELAQVWESDDDNAHEVASRQQPPGIVPLGEGNEQTDTHPNTYDEGLLQIQQENYLISHPQYGMDGFVAIPFGRKEPSRDVLDIHDTYKPRLHDPSEETQLAFSQWVETMVVEMHGTGEPQVQTLNPDQGVKDIYFAIWTDYGRTPTASAWRVFNGGEKTEFLIENTAKNGSRYVSPRGHVHSGTVTKEVYGCHAAFHGWHSQSYGHTVDYHLAQISYLKAQVDEECRFLLLDNRIGPLPSILHAVDPALYARVTWIHPREVAKIVDGSLVVSHNPGSEYYPKFGANAYLQAWLTSLPYKSDPDQTIILYCSRVPPQTNTRVMDVEHNEAIKQLIQQKMIDHGRNEQLVDYDGTRLGEDGQMRSLTPMERFYLFRSATTLIGSHGTGMTNMLWMDLTAERRPQVVEFTAGPNSSDDELRRFAFENYSRNYWGLPFDYHVLLFTPESRDAGAFVDLNLLSGVLDELWS